MTIVKRTFCLLIALAAMVSLSACDMPMSIVGDLPEPEETVTCFFDSVCEGDFEGADEYLSGVSLSMRDKVTGVFSQKLYDYLLKSYSYQLKGPVKSDGLDAECAVDFTYLDLNLLNEDLKNLSTKIGKSYISEAKEGYVEKKDDAISLTDEGAEKIAAEALDSLMATPEKYYSTKTFKMRMKYSFGKWLIYMTDDLFEAISGGFETND